MANKVDQSGNGTTKTTQVRGVASTAMILGGGPQRKDDGGGNRLPSWRDHLFHPRSVLPRGKTC